MVHGPSAFDLNWSPKAEMVDGGFMQIATDQFNTSEAELFSQLGSPSAGLSSEAAAERLRETGPNTVAVGPRQTVWGDLLHRCRNPLVIQLFIIAAVVVPDGRPALDRGGGRHGVPERVPLLHPGGPLLTGGREAAEAGQDHRHRAARRQGDGGAARGDRAGRHRHPGRRQPDSGGPADSLGQGFLRQPVGADRRIDAGGEERRDRTSRPAGRRSSSPTPVSWAATC